MILECPNCGFAGRLPDHATPMSRRARCPRCRLGFDIPGPHVEAPPRPSASDSNYELDPIAHGFDGSWDAPWPVDTDETRLPAAIPRPSRRVVRIPRLSGLRVRLFQAWAVLFMAAAASIGLRTAAAAARFDDARFFSGDLLRPVAAVVLLVSAAALLCLYLDVSRRLSRLTYGPPPRAVDPVPPLASRSRDE